jgi:homoserine dehydrogenase
MVNVGTVALDRPKLRFSTDDRGGRPYDTQYLIEDNYTKKGDTAMAYVAVLGYGVVGSGVAAALTGNTAEIAVKAGKKIEIKRILDLRDFGGSPFADKFTKDFNDILNDPEIEVAAEAMGGIEPAYSYTKALLEKGKSVVTSNKELVAERGAELLETARRNNANYLFEGAVCGGIPLVRTLYGALTADRVQSVAGIMNGTTNYILTKMAYGGDYAAALAEAQELGYAERDPDDDVLAKDPCRKLAILMSLCVGKNVDYRDIYTEGITHLTKEDILYAKKLGGAVKLIAYADLGNNQLPITNNQLNVRARVAPAIIADGHPLYGVNDVFNGVLLNCDVTGEVMLYGRGAGQMPTGGAVAADVVAAVRAGKTHLGCCWGKDAQRVLSKGLMTAKKFIRVAYTDKDKAAEIINRYYKIERFAEIGLAGEMGFVTDTMVEEDIDRGVDELDKAGVRVLGQVYVY